MTTGTVPAIRVTVAVGAAAHKPMTIAAVAVWIALRERVAGWWARQSFKAGIAHLDDRLLADVGLEPRHRGLADRLVRHLAPGGDLWPRG